MDVNLQLWPALTQHVYTEEFIWFAYYALSAIIIGCI